MPLRLPPFQPSGQAIIAQRDLSAGLNLKSGRFSVPLNQFVVLQNTYLAEDGSLLGRRGTLLLNASPIGSGAISGATRAYFTANNFWLGIDSTGVVRQSTDGTTFTSSLTGLTAGSLGWFVQYLTFVYLATKADAPRKWDGTTWTNMGLAAPAGTPAVAVGAAGTPSGTYTVEITFVSPTLESNPSPASASVTVASQQINVSSIPTSSDTQVTKRNVYGFKNTVSSTYQLIGTINDNTTTTFTVTTDQGSWGVAPPTTNNQPVTGAWITVEFKNRLWKAGDANKPNRLYFSQIFVPEAWPTTFFVDIPFDKGDAITGLFVLGDLLLVYGNNSVFYVFGDTPFSFVVKQSFAQSGCPSPWAIDRVENSAIYLSRFGVYVFDGAQARLITDPIDPTFTGLFSQITAMNFAAANRATLKYYDRLKAIVVSFPTGAANDTTYWHFLRRQGWTKDTRATQLLLVDDGTGGNGNLYAWDASAGSLRQWDTTYTDDGTAILARWKTGELTGDNPLGLKQFTWFSLRAQPMSATVNISASVNAGVEGDSFTIPLGRGSQIGTAVIGTATLASDADTFDERFAPNMKGASIAIDASITYSAFIRIYEQYITYLPFPMARRRVGVAPS